MAEKMKNKKGKKPLVGGKTEVFILKINNLSL